jgi:hypothetical protein
VTALVVDGNWSHRNCVLHCFIFVRKRPDRKKKQQKERNYLKTEQTAKHPIATGFFIVFQ